MNDLKPCPFCGCTAIYETFTRYYDDGDTAVVFCNGCKSIVILEQNEAEGVNDETRKLAREAWNTRAPYEMSYEDIHILLDELGISERTC